MNQETDRREEFSFYYAPVKNIFPNKTLTMAELIEIVRGERYKAKVEEIRTAKDDDTRDWLKKTKLDYITPGGAFSQRDAQGLKTESGLGHLDIDGLDPEVLAGKIKILKKNLYVHALFISPSGNGLKVFFRIPNDPANYKAYLRAFSEMSGAKHDEKAEDITRACFLTHDPDAYYNPNSLIWDEKAEVQDKKEPLDYKTIITQGAEEKKRNNSYFLLACQRKAAGIDIQTTTADILLINSRSQKPLDESEIHQLIRSAYSYKKNQEDDSNGIFKWKEHKKSGKWFKQGIDVLKAKDWLLNKTKFISHGKKIITIYRYDSDKGIYVPDGQRYIAEKLQEETAGEFLTKHILTEILGHIERSTYADLETLKQQSQDWICLKNGILNVKTREFKPHTSECVFLQQIPVNFMRGYECSKIKSHFEKVLIPEDIPVMQEFLGYCLLRSQAFKKAFIFLGERDTGKTTTLNIIIAFLGKQNVSGESLHRLISDKFSAITIKDKSLNSYDDLDTASLENVNALKVLTGNGLVSGEEKFGDRTTFESTCKLLFACNQIPALKNKDQADEAYFNRWIIFLFQNEMKINLQYFNDVYTDEEMSGLLNWSLEGLDRLLIQNKFSYRLDLKGVMDLMQRDFNSIAAFAQDCVKESQDIFISKDDFYSVYCDYCKSKNEIRQSKDAFGKSITKFAPYVLDYRKKLGNKQVSGWLNVQLHSLQGFSEIIYINKNNTIYHYLNSSYDLEKDMQGMQQEDINKLLDPVLLPCSVCGAPPPCQYEDRKGRPICELCSNPDNESAIEMENLGG